MAVIATHPRATDRNLAAVEADLAFGSAPALPHSVAAPAMRFAGELLGILAQHLLNSFNPSRQTKALKRAVHILPSRRKAGHERERWGNGSAGHGVALLCGFGTPSLTAQGGQRLHPYFNNGRDIPPGPSAEFDTFYLLWAMTLKIVRDQWRRVVFMQTNREDVGKRYLEISIPLAPNAERAADVSTPFRDYYTKIADARVNLQNYLAASGQHHFFVSGAEFEDADQDA